MNDEKIEKAVEDADETKGDEDSDEEGKPSTERVEGEGSYTATRKYNKDLENALRRGNSEELAEKARKALEGPERKELEEAERAGKARRRD